MIDRHAWSSAVCASVMHVDALKNRRSAGGRIDESEDWSFLIDSDVH